MNSRDMLAQAQDEMRISRIGLWGRTAEDEASCLYQFMALKGPTQIRKKGQVHSKEEGQVLNPVGSSSQSPPN